MDLKQKFDDFANSNTHVGREMFRNESSIKIERIAERYMYILLPLILPILLYTIASLLIWAASDDIDSDWAPLSEPLFYAALLLGLVGEFKYGRVIQKNYDTTTAKATTKWTEDEYIEGSKLVDTTEFNAGIQEHIRTITERNKEISNIKDTFEIELAPLNVSDKRFEKNGKKALIIPRFSLNTGLGVVGIPGQGKTVLISHLAAQVDIANDKSFIVDNKGDFVTMFFNPDTDIIFCPSDMRTCRINIIDLFDNYVNVGVIADIIVGDAGKNSDGNSEHFMKSAKIFLEAIFIYAKKHSLSNREIFELITSREQLERIKDEDEEVATLIQNYFLGTSGDELKSVLTTLMTKSRVFQFMFFADNLSDNAVLELQKWVLNGRGGRLFFLATEELNVVFAPLYGAIIGKIFSILLNDNETREKRYYFFLNELPQLGKMLGEYLVRGLAVGRSKGLNIVADMQSPEQLKAIWGEANANVFFDTCNSIVCFKSQFSATFFEKFFGKTKVKRPTDSGQFGGSDNRDGFGFSRSTVIEPLLSDSDFLMLNELEFYARIAGLNSVVKSKLAPKFVKARDNVEKYVENPAVNINILPVRYKAYILNLETIYFSTKVARESAHDFISIDL